MSLRHAFPFRALLRRAAARRRLVLGTAACFALAALVAAGFFIEARARAADQAFRTPSGSLAAFVDDDGNLALRGTVHVVQPVVPPADAWVVRSPDGTVQAALDLRDGPTIGDLYLRESMYTETPSILYPLVPENGYFRVILASQNHMPPWVFRSADGSAAAAVAYTGSAFHFVLRGVCSENGQDAPLAAPTLVARPLIEAVRLDFTASPSGLVSGYRVEMSTTGQAGPFSAVAPQDLTWLGPTACARTGLTADGTTYYFQVHALAEGFVGPPSNVASAVPFTQCQQPWPEGWK